MEERKERYIPVKSLSPLAEYRRDPPETAVVGSLAETIGDEFVLRGPDGSGGEVEWVIKPTGANSFELTVPAGHDLGSPDAWEGVSIMTQRVFNSAENCGCQGGQCGCQGGNCGSQGRALTGRIRLADRAVSALINPATLEQLRRNF